MRLKDRIAVVTGAGQGMGRAIAQRFAHEGATVVAIDVNLAAAEETLAGSPGLARMVNIGDSAAVNACFDEVVARFGRIDVLVNNAGVGSVDAFADIPDETWARVIGVNLTGAFYCARAAIRNWAATTGATSSQRWKSKSNWPTSSACRCALRFWIWTISSASTMKWGIWAETKCCAPFRAWPSKACGTKTYSVATGVRSFC